jgi:DnaK suppressor protein
MTMRTDNPIDPLATTELDLATARRTLEAELIRRDAIVRELEPRAIPSVDPVSYMTTVSTRRMMDQIRAALDRISEGTYGRCIRCGGAIVAARLEVLPYAETCIDCQTEVERIA